MKIVKFCLVLNCFLIVVVMLVSCLPTSLIKTRTLENKVGEVYDFLRPYKDSIPCFVEAEKWPVKINSSLDGHSQGISIEEVFPIRDNILFASLFGKNKNTEYRMIIITSDKKLLFYKEFAEELIKEEENGTCGRYAIGKLTYYLSFSPTIDSQIESLTVIGNTYCPYRIDTLHEMFDYSDAILNKMDSVTIRF